MKNFSIEEFKDKHKGRMIFVVGSGPSIRHITAEQTFAIYEHVVIVVNGAILAFPSADYFVGCDGRFTLTKAWQTMKDCHCELFLNHTLGGYNAYDEQLGIDSYAGISEKRMRSIFKSMINEDRYNLDDSEILITGSSSAHPALHIAKIMGGSPIVLLGMDCRLDDGKKKFTDYEDQPDDGIFKPEWEECVRYAGDGILNEFAREWEELAKANPNLNVINCSDSRWEGWQKKKLDEVL